MDIENIISVFSRLSGSDEETSVNFRFMCENAKDYIISHLKPDSEAFSDISDVFDNGYFVFGVM